ncbi:hypothetical protein JR316_0012270 [Psilocybe cubensis]|uniref:F-box domain-containing protein n=2 Tax=Psilocybe cubensis TaxID=181762 RepID=A0A8H7XP75_PSICU|nr:hypothetical protein JR316_0012270 [Psilocybe cubensis]KAH9475159.1 hypothetical protein JR316_0012270 [Psilocybe cubensis]
MGKLRTINSFPLPSELYEKIFAYCTNHDIYHVAQSCRYLYQVSIRVLYRIIPKMDLSRTINFLISVCFYKHHAPYVWSLSIVMSKTDICAPLSKMETFQRLRKLGNPMKSLSFRNVLQDYMTLISTTIQKLSNLRMLELRLLPSDSIDSTAARLLGNAPFQLRIFITTLEWGAAMGRFLQSQREMKELQCPITIHPDKDIISPGILPNLDSLSWSDETPMATVRLLMHGRPITRVSLRFHRKCTDITPFIDIGAHSSSIKHGLFTFQAAVIKSEFIAAIALKFPAVCEVAIKVREMSEASVLFITQNHCG